MLKFAFGFFVAMIVSYLVTGIYLGYYKNVNTAIITPETYILLGKNVTGPYNEANQYIEEVEKWAKENSVDCPKSFGQYLDDPQKIEPEKLRSFVGCVLDSELSETGPYQLKHVKIEKAYSAKFGGSPALGPLKVYPDVYDWFKQNNILFPFALEIYTLNEGKYSTLYLFPIPVDEINTDKVKL
jgi:hypothetical protein